LLFVRFLPMVAISEVKGVVPHGGGEKQVPEETCV
jgi:hypothetical protein